MKLLALAFRCECGTRPRWRVFPGLRKRLRDARDDEPVATWTCHGCGASHIVTARAFKDAA